MKGDFPIGFLIWKTDQNAAKQTPLGEITVEILNKKAQQIGEKLFYNLPSTTYLNAWMDKPQTNDELALPLSNALKVSSNPRLKKSCDDMVGYLYASNNDLQHAGQETLISSSIFTGGNGGGLYIKEENLWQAAVVSLRGYLSSTHGLTTATNSCNHQNCSLTNSKRIAWSGCSFTARTSPPVPTT